MEGSSASDDEVKKDEGIHYKGALEGGKESTVTSTGESAAPAVADADTKPSPKADTSEVGKCVLGVVLCDSCRASRMMENHTFTYKHRQRELKEKPNRLMQRKDLVRRPRKIVSYTVRMSSMKVMKLNINGMPSFISKSTSLRILYL